MLQLQDVTQVRTGRVWELRAAYGTVDGHVSLRRIQVKRVDGVGVRFLPVHQQDVVLQTAPSLLPARLPSPNQT